MISHPRLLGWLLQRILETSVFLFYDVGLLPELVRVGNETNIQIMQDSAAMNVNSINRKRSLTLLNTGLKAVEEFSNQS